MSEWHDIVQASAGAYHAVGLRRDGTVVATECVSYYEELDDVNCLDIADWRDIVQVCAGVGVTAGLRSDGHVLLACNGDDGWMDWDVGATAISVSNGLPYCDDCYDQRRYPEEVLVLDGAGHAEGMPSHGAYDWCNW